MQPYPIKSPRKLIEVALAAGRDQRAACAGEKNPFVNGHPRAFIFGGRGGRWRRRGRSYLRNWSTIPATSKAAGSSMAKTRRKPPLSGSGFSRSSRTSCSGKTLPTKEVLERARAEIRRSWREVCELNKDHPQASELFNPDELPALHDPFAGGGAIPLEAQRLGARGLRFRPQSRGRAHQQGHDRDSAKVRRPKPGKSRMENEGTTNCDRLGGTTADWRRTFVIMARK